MRFSEVPGDTADLLGFVNKIDSLTCYSQVHRIGNARPHPAFSAAQ